MSKSIEQELSRLRELERAIVFEFPIEEFENGDDKGALELYRMLLADWRVGLELTYRMKAELQSIFDNRSKK